MLIIAHAPHRQNKNQRENRPAPAARWAAGTAAGDLFPDQAGEGRRDQSNEQRAQHERLHNEHDVPRIPLAIKRREGTQTVIVGEIQQQMARGGEATEQKE